MNRKKLAKIKLENLKKGYSAFTDSDEIASLLKRELTTLDVPVHIDHTTVGYWFIPDKSESSSTQS